MQTKTVGKAVSSTRLAVFRGAYWVVIWALLLTLLISWMSINQAPDPADQIADINIQLIRQARLDKSLIECLKTQQKINDTLIRWMQHEQEAKNGRSKSGIDIQLLGTRPRTTR